MIEILCQHRDSEFPELVPTSAGTEHTGTASGSVPSTKNRPSWSSHLGRPRLNPVAGAVSSPSWPQSKSKSPPISPTFQPPPPPPALTHYPRQRSVTLRADHGQGSSNLFRPRQNSETSWTDDGNGSSSGFRPRYRRLTSTNEPRPKRMTTPPPLSGSAFPELSPTIPNKSPKNTLGGPLSARSAWSRGPPIQPLPLSFDPDPQPYPEPEPSPEPDSEPEYELEPEYFPELESATIDGKEWKGKERQILTHQEDCACFSCYPSLGIYRG